MSRNIRPIRTKRSLASGGLEGIFKPVEHAVLASYLGLSRLLPASARGSRPITALDWLRGSNQGPCVECSCSSTLPASTFKPLCDLRVLASWREKTQPFHFLTFDGTYLPVSVAALRATLRVLFRAGSHRLG